MNSSLWAKFLAAVLLFAMWLALVIMKMVPAEPLVLAIGQALVGLGVYHASTGTSAKSGDTPIDGKLVRTQTFVTGGEYKPVPGTTTVSVERVDPGAAGGYQPEASPAAPPPAPVSAPAPAAATLQ
ncbi:hypothetical protein [Paraburkholderia caribensis]|uniref:hypothetical protein n=1 Tax=Paraburkholderia caribensis TaxID=75105 RepID=UPI001CC7C3C5|nr:hypothetical protein [Paraburkholderia caribensis]